MARSTSVVIKSVIWAIGLTAIPLLKAETVDTILPPKTSLNPENFKQWQTAYTKKSDVIDELLNSAGLNRRSPSYLNELILQASPYLLRHAVNPINWMAWGDDAFDKAAYEGKLIFLSIGYSTCHWCHVMEKESFVDLDVAKILNQHFINIKIDRELQPDIDAYFTDVLTTVKGSAGWPITAILTTKGEPIWIDSYVVKDKLLIISERFAKIWQTQPKRLLQVADNISNQVASLSLETGSKWSTTQAKSNLDELLSNLDADQGGLIGAPKFPSESLLLLALQAYQQGASKVLKSQLTLWLSRLTSRGIRDHVNGGFHRYATDAIWQVPHYEKMLYNQALLIKVFAQAGYLLKDQNYIDVAKDTVAFLERVMKSQTGGYYSAIDADYFEQEGRYYLFSKDEKAMFESKTINAFAWYQFKNKELYAPYINEQNNEDKSLKKARAVLLTERAKLALPHIDKKILLSWNALLVDAFVQLYMATDDVYYLSKAQSLVTTLEEKLIDNGKLKRAYYLNSAGGEALFEDYVYLANAYQSLYTATFEFHWQSKAKSMLREIVNRKLVPQTIRNSSDGELISPDAVFYQLAKQYAFSDSVISQATRKHKKNLQNAYLRNPKTSFSSVTSLLNLQQTSKRHTFAQGNGQIKLQTGTSNQAKLVINLKPKWHINSHIPNEKSLIATELLIDGNKIDNTAYPQPVTKKLGFNQAPLSLFEQSIEIDFQATGKWLKVKLQACSDEVCLLPESFTLKL
ncbi:thioredoxin domain-containing protein [Pseudoalteromonas sp.]|uniref:thioredoxin domain-containing protein n=1 Tax=Pseudoalteromonas sp. TaxID=53249 RepID=UPI003569905C